MTGRRGGSRGRGAAPSTLAGCPAVLLDPGHGTGVRRAAAARAPSWHCRSCCWLRSSSVSRPARSAAFATSCSRAGSSSACSSSTALVLLLARDRDRARRAHALGTDPGPRPARRGHGRRRPPRRDRRDARLARGWSWSSSTRRSPRCSGRSVRRSRGPAARAAAAGSRGAGQRARVRVGRHRADQHPPARNRCGPRTRHRPDRRDARRQRGPGRADRGDDQRPARHRLRAAARRDALRRRALPRQGQRARDGGGARPGDVVPRSRRRRGGVRPANDRALDRPLPRRSRSTTTRSSTWPASRA